MMSGATHGPVAKGHGSQGQRKQSHVGQGPERKGHAGQGHGAKSKGKEKKKTGTPEIETIFDQMDLNHDGRISVHELTKAARIIGLNPTRKEAEDMIADCNPSQKGYVNLTEFKRIFDQYQHDVDEQENEIKKAFAIFDKDNSGTISKDEIRAVLKKCGEDIDDDEIEDMLQAVDADGDGMISIDEFASVMCE